MLVATQFRDLIHYADRLVTRYQPRLIVLHGGGNVIHAGRTPAQVLGDWVHPNHERYLVRVRLTQRLLGPPDRAK